MKRFVSLMLMSILVIALPGVGNASSQNGIELLWEKEWDNTLQRSSHIRGVKFHKDTILVHTKDPYNKLEVYNFAGEKQFEIPLNGGARTYDFESDLLYGSVGRTMKVYSLNDGSLVNSFRIPSDAVPQAYTNSVSDNLFIMRGYTNGKGKVYGIDTRNGKVKWTLHEESGHIRQNKDSFFWKKGEILYAYDKQSGKLKWEKHLPYFDILNGLEYLNDELLIIENHDNLQALNAETGEWVWDILTHEDSKYRNIYHIDNNNKSSFQYNYCNGDVRVLELLEVSEDGTDEKRITLTPNRELLGFSPSQQINFANGRMFKDGATTYVDASFGGPRWSNERACEKNTFSLVKRENVGQGVFYKIVNGEVEKIIYDDLGALMGLHKGQLVFETKEDGIQLYNSDLQKVAQLNKEPNYKPFSMSATLDAYSFGFTYLLHEDYILVASPYKLSFYKNHTIPFYELNAFAEKYKDIKVAKEVSIVLEGEKLSTDLPPMIQNGTTLVPLRNIFEGLGASVKWDSETKQIIAKKRDQTIILTLGSKETLVNGKVEEIEASAINVEGKTFVPVRFISESLGANVNWNSQTKVIEISMNK